MKITIYYMEKIYFLFKKKGNLSLMLGYKKKSIISGTITATHYNSLP